ncbi:MAG: sulfite oxidase heme-binding subunit YedZ [Candidatus Methylumidiphilus sp.]
MRQLSNPTVDALRRGLFLACLLPFARLLAGWLTDDLAPDPVEDITHTTGLWSLRLLLLMLVVSPLKRHTGWNWLMRLRRTLALYAFFYAVLHVLAYLVFEQYFDGPEILKDATRRPYVMAGWVAFLCMVPLAVTSTNAMMKRLGGRNWKRLHQLTYLIAVAAVLHYFWLVKQDTTAPAGYAVALAVLLCLRLAAAPRPSTAPPRKAGAALAPHALRNNRSPHA